MKFIHTEAPFELLSSPPYCPNPQCPMHHPVLAKQAARFIFHDSRPVTRFPYQTNRFRCAHCRKVFSDSIFHLFYRDRTESTYQQIFHYHVHCESRRALARDLQCSSSTVQRRFRKMGARGLLIQAQKTKELKIEEPIVYDGLENFAFSQYCPNSINHALGKESLFLYDFNYSPLNRKGRRTAEQLKREQELDRIHGRFPPNAIHSATTRVFERLLKKTPEKLILFTDDHHAYKKSILDLKDRERIVHDVTSSRVHRDSKNPLFAVNHADSLTRHNLATFKRETIAFAKHSIGMIESFTLFMVWKNFMRPKFVNKKKHDPKAHLESPAMKLGLEEKILTFKEFFRLRVFPTQVDLNLDWQNFLNRKDPTSRQPIAA